MTISDPRLKRAAWTLICAAAFSLAFGCSRAKRTVYVPAGSPVRIRQTIKAAPVWVMDENGLWIPGAIDIPEGWYTLPDPDDGTENGTGSGTSDGTGDGTGAP
jgi:hypothetical protein